MSERIHEAANSFVQTLIFISVVLFVHLGFKTWADASFEMVSLGISEKWLYTGFCLSSLF